MKSASMDFFAELVSIVLLRDDDLVTRESLSDIWKEIRTFMSTVVIKDVEWKEQEIARGSPRKLPDPRAL